MNESAFPRIVSTSAPDIRYRPVMTLRDYYDAKAMELMINRRGVLSYAPLERADQIAKIACDAMLKGLK